MIEFKSTKTAQVKLLKTATENKEYWKALRLLNSILQEKPNTYFFCLGTELVKNLPNYADPLDYVFPLLVSNDINNFFLGCQVLIAYFYGLDDDKCKFYQDLLLKTFNQTKTEYDIGVLEQIIGVPFMKPQFSFVEKTYADQEPLDEMDKALAMGEPERIIQIYQTTHFEDESMPMANKLVAEAYLLKKDYKIADTYLKKIPTEQKDAYFLALLTRMNFEQKNESYKTSLKQLLDTPIDCRETLIFVVETLLTCKQPAEAVKMIQKYLNEYQYFYPIQFALGLSAYQCGNIALAKESFNKCYLLNPKQIPARELYLCLEEGIALPKNISIHDSFPEAIVKRIETRINSVLTAPKEEIEKMSTGRILQALYSLELLENQQVVERMLMRCLNHQNGVDAVKILLLSSSTSKWLKQICIQMLLFFGANDIEISFVDNGYINQLKLVLPSTIANEFEVGQTGFVEEELATSLFLHAYGRAFSLLAFLTSNFEKRLQEVANHCVRGMISFISKQKRKKISEKTIICALLYATCSDNLPCELKTKCAHVSKYSTLTNAAAECEIQTQELQDFIKETF